MARWGIERHREAVAKRLKGLDKKPNIKRRLEKAYAQTKKSPAIIGKCLECFGFENVYREIRYCKGWDCPLWAVRPYQVEGDPMGIKETEVNEAEIEDTDED